MLPVAGTSVLALLLMRGLDPAESRFRSAPSFALFWPMLTLALCRSDGPLLSNSSSVDDAELEIGRDMMMLARGDSDCGILLARKDDGFGKYVKGDAELVGDGLETPSAERVVSYDYRTPSARNSDCIGWTGDHSLRVRRWIAGIIPG